MTHIMLDLETWGTEPGSDLRSIGAIVFDPVAGTFGNTFYRNVHGGDQLGLKRDPKTEKWWSEQSIEAQAALKDDLYSITAAIADLTQWLEKQQRDPAELRIWAHGPTFDVTLLQHVYSVAGLALPWHYRSPRCTRTIFEAAGGVEIPTQGTYHNALDDARNQAAAVIDAYKKLGLSHKWRPDQARLVGLICALGKTTSVALRDRVGLKDRKIIDMNEHETALLIAALEGYATARNGADDLEGIL